MNVLGLLMEGGKGHALSLNVSGRGYDTHCGLRFLNNSGRIALAKTPQKSTGEIGVTKLTATPEGLAVEIIHVALPIDKEGLEHFFATRFVQTFNETHPLGASVAITKIEQNDTSDLDFRISCRAADYIELAELNPRSEAFGREAYRSGKLNVYEYAKWIFHRIIKKKGNSYGEAVAGRSMLLLYATHWQFYPGERLIECIRSHIQVHGCNFAAVFFLMTNGDELRVLTPAHPYAGSKLPKPSAYSGITYWNLPPGHSSWTLPPIEPPELLR